jgi:hypothetical protein
MPVTRLTAPSSNDEAENRALSRPGRRHRDGTHRPATTKSEPKLAGPSSGKSHVTERQ